MRSTSRCRTRCTPTTPSVPPRRVSTCCARSRWRSRCGECRRMIAACRRADVKLMVAYRLHFEALNLSAIELARSGQLGDLKFFNSSFSMRVRRGDIRTKRAYGGGTLYDIGVYCINAARNLFRAEPTQVSAMSVNSGAMLLAEIDETTAAILRFGGRRLATFVTSFNASDVASYRLVGTKGRSAAGPRVRVRGRARADGDDRRQDDADKRRASATSSPPELLHFSDCILKDRPPEPSGEEGLQDVRIVQALYESARTGRVVRLPPFADRHRPSARQAYHPTRNQEAGPRQSAECQSRMMILTGIAGGRRRGDLRQRGTTESRRGYRRQAAQARRHAGRACRRPGRAAGALGRRVLRRRRPSARTTAARSPTACSSAIPSAALASRLLQPAERRGAARAGAGSDRVLGGGACGAT